MWECRCACGTMRSVRGYALTGGNSTSCGCKTAEATRTRSLTHGRRNTAEYGIYRAMLNRCYQASQKVYPLYGGRGITVCERWRESFMAFLEDMGERPSTSHSLDRIDCNGHYEPSNCRWATSLTQNNNRRNNRILSHAGKSQTMSEWAREIGVSPKFLWSRLNKGQTLAGIVEEFA